MAKELKTVPVYPIRVCAADDCVNYTDQAVEQNGKVLALCANHRNAEGVKQAAASDNPQGTSLPVMAPNPEMVPVEAPEGGVPASPQADQASE